jgi:hypothetical protein
MKPIVLSLLTLLAAPPRSNAASKFQESIHIIRAVGPEGRGNAEAARAWKDLSDSGPETLLAVLARDGGRQ